MRGLYTLHDTRYVFNNLVDLKSSKVSQVEKRETTQALLLL